MNIKNEEYTVCSVKFATSKSYVTVKRGRRGVMGGGNEGRKEGGGGSKVSALNCGVKNLLCIFI